MLHIRNVVKSYQDLHAVKGVDLTVSQGRALRIPGTQWCRQNHHHQNDRGSAQTHLGHHFHRRI